MSLTLFGFRSHSLLSKDVSGFMAPLFNRVYICYIFKYTKEKRESLLKALRLE
jgi:lysine/ornithine N-monooxygenase